MITIDRRENESFIIDNEIEVTVLEVCPDRIRLAISAPDDTPSYREETLYLNEADAPQELELLTPSVG